MGRVLLFAMTLATSYLNPDLDGVACAVGMAELLRRQGMDVRAAVFGTPSAEARWVMETYEIPAPPDGQTLLAPDTEIILLDASNPLDLERAFLVTSVVEIIDHREAHGAKEFPNVRRVQVELVGSCATLVAERMQAANITPVRDTARLLFGAIMSNTVNFRAPVTTDRDRRMADWLVPIAALPATFALDMFAAKSDLSGAKLRETIIGDYTVKEFGGTRIICFQVEANGIAELYQTRREEIEAIMREVCAEERCVYSSCNGIDLAEARTYLLVTDEASQHLFERALRATFHDRIASFDWIYGRKQMMPKIKAELERYH